MTNSEYTFENRAQFHSHLMALIRGAVQSEIEIQGAYECRLPDVDPTFDVEISRVGRHRSAK